MAPHHLSDSLQLTASVYSRFVVDNLVFILCELPACPTIFACPNFHDVVYTLRIWERQERSVSSVLSLPPLGPRVVGGRPLQFSFSFFRVLRPARLVYLFGVLVSTSSSTGFIGGCFWHVLAPSGVSCWDSACYWSQYWSSFRRGLFAEMCPRSRCLSCGRCSRRE